MQIEAEAALLGLPWELLHDGQIFLCLRPAPSLLPQRQVNPRQTPFELATRPLRILFMACSPEDVLPVLNFEQEEARILQGTEKYSIFLHVEESGSLAGLQEQIEASDAGYFDVVHLSGHAGIDDKTHEPVFYMEDLSGQCDKVSPDRLATVFNDCEQYPRVLFLSGCRTGEAQDHSQAFSERMVTLGLPVVLGWALPVNDAAATEAACYFYEKLSTGISVAQALVTARRRLHEYEQDQVKQGRMLRPNNWHLLRLYTDATPLTPLISKPHAWTEQVSPESKQRFLDPVGQQTEVCDRRGFIGRRRLLQGCLRALVRPNNHPDAVLGILLHGMGGLGKSSTAARLADRLQASHTLVVWRGKIDDTRIRQELHGYLAAMAGSRASLQQQLVEVFQKNTLLLVFDDFEQNLDSPEVEKGITFTPDSLHLIQQVLAAIQQSASRSRVIITSRYPPPIDARYPLYTGEPNRLRGTDLEKKCHTLSQLKKDSPLDATLRQTAITLADGIPRLLEWMNKALEQQAQQPQALLDKLTQTQQDYREHILIENLLTLQNRQSRQTLAMIALFHLPQPFQVIQPMLLTAQNETDWQSSHEAGLLEKIDGEPPQYYVSVLLHERLAYELTPEQRQQAMHQAADSLYEYANEQGLSEITDREILRLAIQAQHTERMITVGDRLSNFLWQQNRWQEMLTLCQSLLAMHEDFHLLTQLARTEFRLGLPSSADHFERAIALFPAEPDDDILFRKASTQLNYADLLIQQGQTDLALDRLQTQVLPIFKQLEQHRDAAITQGKIADILQARGQFDEALRIRHEEELPVYEQLGDVRQLLVGRTNMAILLWKMHGVDKTEEIQALLCESLNAAERLSLPEAETIKGILQEFDLSC